MTEKEEKGDQVASEVKADQEPAGSDVDANDNPTGQTDELIDMEKAAEMLKTTRSTFYRWLREGRIKGMKVGRQWRFYREDIERFLEGQEPRIDLPADIGPLISDLRKRAQELGAEDVPSPEDIPLQDADKVIEAVDIMTILAILMNATDIHLAAHIKEGGESVAVLRYRIDGALREIAQIDTRLLPAIIDRWKTLGGCDVLEKRMPQDSKIVVKEAGKECDLRFCILPTALGESLTARIADRAAMAGAYTDWLKIENLGFAPRDTERILRCLESPWGMFITSGPTGSGRTTMLYALLRHTAGPELKVITVEDPVHYILPSAVQVQVQPDIDFTMAEAVRATLRSDPDIIMIGEIRDAETLDLAMECALTGHVVMTQLHVLEAAVALKRMADLGSNPTIIGEAVRLIINQRLVRRLCDCSVEQSPPLEMLDRAAELTRAGGIDWDSLPKKFREPVGCAKCNETGYKGRIAIIEALEITPKIIAALQRDASVEEMRAIAVSQGMTTIAADGIRRATKGITSLIEVMRVVGPR